LIFIKATLGHKSGANMTENTDANSLGVARGIVPLLRSAYPQSAATMRWWVFLDDFVQYDSSSFDAMSDRQKR